MLLLGVAFLVCVAIIFANLAMERSVAQADYDRAFATLEQAKAQNARLQYELGQTAGEQQLLYWAYRLFGLAPQGTKVIEGQPAVVEAALVSEVRPAEQPFWLAWWEKLRQP
jgi:high-affinity K+ transport system ATPase subunit B